MTLAVMGSTVLLEPEVLRQYPMIRWKIDTASDENNMSLESRYAHMC